ncbi:hypothetical protein AB6A40_008923 [Gnathostoma spinigerum]|uniref:Peptidase C1A papain C-terminal domain-containing protein n=1 Tax=Gnathostoma spinigerum TaxID=75299 RepID=A0ABD6EQG2_9BILA
MIFLISSIHHHLVSAVASDGISGHLKGEALADFINNHQSLWKAKYDKENEIRMNYLMDAKYVGEDPYENIPQTKLANVNLEIPKEFDAREKWPHCKSIGKIQDQSKCGMGLEYISL